MEDKRDKGKFVKGHPGLKQKGTIHNTSARAIQQILDFTGDRYEEIQRCFDKLDDEAKVRYWIQLMKLIVPSNINLTGQLNPDQMQQLINTKFPFGGINPAAVQQEPDPPDPNI